MSDVAGLVKGLTTDISLDVLLAVALFVLTAYVLWRMPFGLRLRSAGERPSAADSLGVPVIRYRYYGMIASGALAGFGGAILVLFANRYQENQVAGRGFLGLATLVVGNWRPAGVAAGAGLFGYFQGITLRTNPEQLVLALVLVGALALAVAAAAGRVPHVVGPFAVLVGLAVACAWLYVAAERSEQPVRVHLAIPRHADRRVGAGAGVADRRRRPASRGARGCRSDVVHRRAIDARTSRPTSARRGRAPLYAGVARHLRSSCVLSIDQLAAYHRDGFVVVEEFVPPAVCEQLQARAEEIVEAFEPTEQHTVFTTDEQERASNREFLDSGAGIWCFFEAEAIGPDGRLVTDKARSINKIGHAMHDLDPVFEAFSYTPELAEIAADLGLTDPLALQSMYIFKQPHIGGEVGCHQDAPFLYTDPITVTGFWFAIEDATLDNGCLWAQPGGHLGPLRRVFQRRDDGGEGGGDLTEFVELDDTPHATGAAGPRATGRAGRHDGRAARPAAALERRQPVSEEPPRLQPALHLRVGGVPGVELAAAATRPAAAAPR